MLAGFRDGTNSYGSPIKTTNNLHPNGYIITAESEDRYAAFARAMGDDPSESRNCTCDFYDRTYMTALQDQLVSKVMDYPWVDCSCTSRGCCSGIDQNKTGDALQPLNLDAQLQTNFAFDSLYAAKGLRSLTMNRVPGRGDGTNYNDAALNGSCGSSFGTCLRHNLGAHRYPAAWTGDIGDDPSHLVNSISLFPAACAGHLWCAFSVDLGPYTDSLPATHPVNAARYIRFVQWGVFSSIFRPHDGGNADTRIWTFADEHYQILRDYTRLRGSLTPWVYALAARTRDESIPFSRPMYWDFGAEAVANHEDPHAMTKQYMFGDRVLVRPISVFVDPSGDVTPPFNLSTTKAVNESEYSVWIPPGCWLMWNASDAPLCGRPDIVALQDCRIYLYSSR
jgi:hypothetical protein